MTHDSALPTPDQFEQAIETAFTLPQDDAPEAPTGASQFVLLSDLLNEIHEDERLLILKEFEDGIIHYEVLAVPATDQRFTIKYRDARNRKRTMERAEELVFVNDAFTSWFEGRRVTARRAAMLVTGDIGIRVEEARKDPTRARELAELRSEYLRSRQPTPKEENKPSAQATRKARAGKTS